MFRWIAVLLFGILFFIVVGIAIERNMDKPAPSVAHPPAPVTEPPQTPAPDSTLADSTEAPEDSVPGRGHGEHGHGR